MLIRYEMRKERKESIMTPKFLILNNWIDGRNTREKIIILDY